MVVVFSVVVILIVVLVVVIKVLWPNPLKECPTDGAGDNHGILRE